MLRVRLGNTRKSPRPCENLPVKAARGMHGPLLEPLEGRVLLSVQTPIALDATTAIDLAASEQDGDRYSAVAMGLSDLPPLAQEVDAMARVTTQAFTPAREVYWAWYGCPAYVGLAPGPFATGSPASLGAGLGPGGGFPNFVGAGRAWGAAFAQATTLSLAGQNYELLGHDYTSPLVLDLDGNGMLDVSGGDTRANPWQPHLGKLVGPFVAFDIDGDGFKDITEWIGPGDALVTTSANPQSGKDLLGTAGGWTDGFQRLRAVADHNGDGIVKGGELRGLYAWRDLDSDGRADSGEVVPLKSIGITSVNATPADDPYVSRYTSSNGQTGIVWDWWPNYGVVNRLPAADEISTAQSVPSNVRAGPLKGLDAAANTADTRVTGSALQQSFTVSPIQLQQAGIDVATFQLTTLCRQGRLAIGLDRTGTPAHARLVALYLGAQGGIEKTAFIPLPFGNVLQLAVSDDAGSVLVLGDGGSKLAVVDLSSRTISPRKGIDLASLGLRASNMAGYDGGYWFTAWPLAQNQTAGEERVWKVTSRGLEAGMSLDALRQEIGDFRGYSLTGSDSGFFTTGDGLGGEILWSVKGSDRQIIRSADAFGGLAAEPDAVVYEARVGQEYQSGFWTGGADTVLATGADPVFYPFVAMSLSGQTSVVTATLLPASHQIAYELIQSSPAGFSQPADLLTTAPGQGKLTDGAFAHYGPNGLTVIPVASGAGASAIEHANDPAPGLLGPRGSAVGPPVAIGGFHSPDEDKKIDPAGLLLQPALSVISWLPGQAGSNVTA